MQHNYSEQLVSIIIPIYNVEQYLERCLNSVKNQTYLNLEILLIDDGSNDNSGAIADSYAQLDTRFKVFHVPNNGVSQARNLGICHMSGEYVFFLDADDYLPNNSIENLYKHINKDIDVVIGSFYVDDGKIEDGIVFEKERVFSINDNIGISTEYEIAPVWGALFSSNLFKDIRFDKRYFVGEDLVVLNQIYMQCRAVKIIPDKIYYYFTRNDSACRTKFSYKKYTEIYAREKVAEMYNDYPKIQKEYWGKYLVYCMSMYIFIINSEIYKSEYLDDLIIRIRDKIKYVKYIPSIKYKIGVLTIAFFPKIFMKLYKIAKNN